MCYIQELCCWLTNVIDARDCLCSITGHWISVVGRVHSMKIVQVCRWCKSRFFTDLRKWLIHYNSIVLDIVHCLRCVWKTFLYMGLVLYSCSRVAYFVYLYWQSEVCRVKCMSLVIWTVKYWLLFSFESFHFLTVEHSSSFISCATSCL